MTVDVFIQKCKDLISLLRVGSYLAAWGIAMELIAALSGAMAEDAFGKPGPRSAIDYDSMSLAELTTALETSLPGDDEGFSAASPRGPVFDLLKPIIFALIKKLIGL